MFILVALKVVNCLFCLYMIKCVKKYAKKRTAIYNEMRINIEGLEHATLGNKTIPHLLSIKPLGFSK